ncbi:hypothetical protein SUDANB105_00725 [Streptomyces sp. enrichment culture]|uniref:hypothetical protein n=1 Tax=Streptomyces sp. enrichment culture TaxID=1795815 RepID=UPI003F569D58
MSSDPAPALVRRAVSDLDQRIEAATGHDVDTLWAHRDRGILDEPHARLVDLHRELAGAEAGVTFFRTLLHRLSSGEFPTNVALLERIDRTVDQMREAAGERDDAAARVITALEPIETANRGTRHDERKPLPPADHAALLAIAGSAKLHEHLLTGRLSVVTSSGTRIPYARFQQLESSGLVSRDTSRPLHAGQPVALTDAGRAALTGSRRASTAPSPAPVRPGTWPAAARPRR